MVDFEILYVIADIIFLMIFVDINALETVRSITISTYCIRELTSSSLKNSLEAPYNFVLYCYIRYSPINVREIQNLRFPFIMRKLPLFDHYVLIT